MHFQLSTYLCTLAFIYTYGRLAIHLVPGIWSYFMSEPSNYQKQIEKPRILFYLTGLGFMHLMSYSHTSMENKSILFQLVISIAFSLGFLLCHLSWTEKFQMSFRAPVKIGTARSSENFNFAISDIQAAQLYHEMIRHDLVDQEKTSLQDFKNVLLEDWTSHHSKLHLKMDGPSCREFYNYLTRTYPNSNLTLKKLFITSGLVLRPDGKNYNYNTLKNAPTRSPFSKQNETLKEIFNKIH